MVSRQYVTISTIGENIYFSRYHELATNTNPTFICPKTDENYGGEYILKIGLLTAEEIYYAGARFNLQSSYQNNDFYLYGISNNINTLTPYIFNGQYVDNFYLTNKGNLTYVTINYSINTLLVVNLRADTLFESGNGDENSPYLIKLK